MWRYTVGPRRLCTTVSTSLIKLEAGEDALSGLAGSIEDTAMETASKDRTAPFCCSNDGKP